MKLAFLSIFVLASISAHACDELIQKFPRDCAIQDRYNKLKEDFAARQIDIDEIAEYRVIRFVDRTSWDQAKTKRVKPDYIYPPAPATWLVWDTGIRQVMASVGKGQLNLGYRLDQQTMSSINHDLLENDTLHLDVKDSITDKDMQPGQFRTDGSRGVGHKNDGLKDYSAAIARSDESLEAFRARWEAAMGDTFQNLLRKYGVLMNQNATLVPHMSVDNRAGADRMVLYAPSSLVSTQVEWIKTFIQINIDKYKEGNPVLSPIELATVVQKWFVSTHPFADGNGRTSRAIQDIILTNFGMPFAPGGDLQDDAEAVYDSYLQNTYSKMESMMSALELCETRNANAFQCQTMDSIKAMNLPTPAQALNAKPRRRD